MSAIKSGADGKPYLKVDFKELFVSSLQISGSSADSYRQRFVQL